MNDSPRKISLPTLLLIVFVVLKLTGLIDWSWLWVLSPLWIPLAIILSVILIFALAALAGVPLKITKKGKKI